MKNKKPKSTMKKMKPNSTSKNKKPKSIENPFSKLPPEILTTILSLLPTKSIIASKRVCKSWCSIIRGPDFDGPSRSIVLIVRRNGDNRGNKNLHLIEPEFNSTVRQRKRNSCYVLDEKSTIKFKDRGFVVFRNKMMEIVNSCNGLVCLRCNHSFYADRPPSYDHELPPFFVCNPVTSDYMLIRQPRPSDHHVDSYAGFGISTVNGRYKLLRFLIDETSGLSGAEAYTLGVDENWRIIDSLTPPNHTLVGKATYFEGSLHWFTTPRTSFGGNIVAFNCHEEDFVVMDVPAGMIFGPGGSTTRPIVDLTILRSRLCLCDCKVAEPKNCVIWVMDIYGDRESWRSLFVVSFGESPDNLMPYKPLSDLKNGEILMLCVNGELVSYDVNSNKWKAVKGPEVARLATKVEAMLFKPSFIPVNNLLMGGEKQGQQ